MVCFTENNNESSTINNNNNRQHLSTSINYFSLTLFQMARRRSSLKARRVLSTRSSAVGHPSRLGIIFVSLIARSIPQISSCRRISILSFRHLFVLQLNSQVSVYDADDGVTDGKVTVTLTCNDASTWWQYQGSRNIYKIGCYGSSNELTTSTTTESTSTSTEPTTSTTTESTTTSTEPTTSTTAGKVFLPMFQNHFP